MDDKFKLLPDDTMRQLRNIALAPGESHWRLELLSTLERMRITQEVSTRGLLQSMAHVRKDISHLTPTKLAELMNAQIEQKQKERDSKRWRASSHWVITHLAAAGIALLVAFVIYKVKSG